MRKWFLLAAAAGFLGVSAWAQGADVTGEWKGAFDYQGKSVPLTFHLKQTGGTVTGTVEGLPTTPAEIHEGKILDDKLSFWANTDYQGQSYKLIFAGKVSGTPEQIQFTMATEDGSWSADLVASKSAEPAAPAATAPDKVTGTWKGSFDFQGSPVPVTLHLTAAGNTVTGSVQGMLQDAPDKPVEIQDGKLNGDTLTFWLTTDYQGESYKIVYTGTVAEGKIHFTFGTDDGSWSSEMTVTKAEK